jgi:hypothetical protein
LKMIHLEILKYTNAETFMPEPSFNAVEIVSDKYKPYISSGIDINFYWSNRSRRQGTTFRIINLYSLCLESKKKARHSSVIFQPIVLLLLLTANLLWIC